MGKFFNNHDLTMDNPVVPLFQGFLGDYPNPIPDSDDDYSLSCYIEEYEDQGRLCARLRDKDTDKKVVFWISSNDSTALEQRNELLEFLSDTKRMNHPELYKKDGNESIIVQAILLSESEDTIELASYFAELFYSLRSGF